MTIQPTTIKDLTENIKAQLAAGLNESLPFFPRSFCDVLAKVFAAVFVMLYKYGGFLGLQLFVQTATIETITILGYQISPLKFWGRLTGVGDPDAATFAEASISIVVTNQTGTLPVNTQLTANGNLYLTKTAVDLDADTVSVNVKATVPGSDSNLVAGQSINFVNAVSNVNQTATVIAQTVTGSNEEAPEVYRQRILDRFQKPPQGGAYADYELWGEEVAGIINVYPYTGLPGQVDVYAEATPESSGNPDGIPTTAQLEEVLESITLTQAGLASRRPANAWVNVYPITRTGFNVTVSGIINVSDLTSVRASIEAALSAYFRSAEPFIVGLSIPPRRDFLTRTSVSALIEAIVASAGGIFDAAVMSVDGSPIGLDYYPLSEGEKAKLVNVFYVG